MRFGRILLSSALVLAASCPGLAKTRHHSATLHKLHLRHSKSTARSHGQRAIDDQRATQIQTALIKSGYLSGQASGHWDSATESAMQKYQGDNGWQTKLTPDSRAIIKLGLGPSQDSAPPSPPPATSSSSSIATTATPGASLLQK